MLIAVGPRFPDVHYKRLRQILAGSVLPLPMANTTTGCCRGGFRRQQRKRESVGGLVNGCNGLCETKEFLTYDSCLGEHGLQFSDAQEPYRKGAFYSRSRVKPAPGKPMKKRQGNSPMNLEREPTIRCLHVIGTPHSADFFGTPALVDFSFTYVLNHRVAKYDVYALVGKGNGARICNNIGWTGDVERNNPSLYLPQKWRGCGKANPGCVISTDIQNRRPVRCREYTSEAVCSTPAKPGADFCSKPGNRAHNRHLGTRTFGRQSLTEAWRATSIRDHSSGKKEKAPVTPKAQDCPLVCLRTGSSKSSLTHPLKLLL